MRNIPTQVLHGSLVILILATFIVGVTSWNSQILKADIAHGAGGNTSGFVWSDTIGWISLSNETDGSTAPYGVSVGTTNYASQGTDSLSGYAWSDNVGWISFNRDTAGNPPLAPFSGGSGAIAQVNWSTGKITGWARALSACDPSCATNSGAGLNAGGWDGWIRLSDDANTSWAGNGARVDLTTGDLKGYAWGDSVVGWIKMDALAGTPEGGSVDLPVSCTIAGVPASGWSTCTTTCNASNAGQTGLPGTRTGTCTSGGVVVDSCNTASCPISVGDGVCGPGETVNNSKDCKPVIKEF